MRDNKVSQISRDSHVGMEDDAKLEETRTVALYNSSGISQSECRPSPCQLLRHGFGLRTISVESDSALTRRLLYLGRPLDLAAPVPAPRSRQAQQVPRRAEQTGRGACCAVRMGCIRAVVEVSFGWDAGRGYPVLCTPSHWLPGSCSCCQVEMFMRPACCRDVEQYSTYSGAARTLIYQICGMR